MAEFCLECFNKMNDTKYTEKQVELSEGFCEGCGKIKPCVISLNRRLNIFKPFKRK